MKFLILIAFIFALPIYAQTTNVNTKKGYAANGYDVVSYFNNIAQKGDSKFVASFKGVNYKFISKTHLNRFLENPVQYIPQYGGYCAYAISKSADKVSINPKSFLVRDNKLYLFYNAWGVNTLKKWLNENQDVLIRKGDLNWSSLRDKK